MKIEGLEKIVPSLDLCKLIPAGKFADSALVWRDRKGNISRDSFAKVREPEDISYANEFAEVRYYPAPTLEEIIADLPSEYEDGALSLGRNYIEYDTPDWFTVDDTSFGSEKDGFAAAALRLWFKVKGIEVK